MIQKKRKKLEVNPSDYGEDYDKIEIVTYEMVKKQPYVIMSNNFKKLRLEESLILADQLSDKLATVRGRELIFEPIHIRFVGKAGQCKTQYALQVMKMLKECGLIELTVVLLIPILMH